MFGFKQFAEFIWRPDLDTQNTGRAVYQRPFGPSKVSTSPNGINNLRSLSPVGPTTFNKPNVAPASIYGRGNSANTNPQLVPLNNATPNAPPSTNVPLI